MSEVRYVISCVCTKCKKREFRSFEDYPSDKDIAEICRYLDETCFCVDPRQGFKGNFEFEHIRER